MFKAMIKRSLLALLMLAPPLLAQAEDRQSPPVSHQTYEALMTDLDHRLDALQSQLNAIRDAKSESLRQSAMERHWQLMQDYMAASLKLAVRQPGAATGDDLAGCRMTGSTWTALPFPGQIRSDDYLKAMQERIGQMHQDLLALHAVRETEALNAALKKHWQSNYQFLQGMRGLDWMFSSWTPSKPDEQLLPDPNSEGAKLTQMYCSVCHAVPKTRLHTAAEWTGVMATMTRHITMSDSGFPMCVQVPSDAEFKAISDYLVKYAR